MNYLVALLAFAAVMIVLATLASVVVEILHLLAGLRRRHFHDFLVATFERVIAPRVAGSEPADGGAATAGRAFVEALLTNPATPTAESRASTIPLIKLAVSSRLTELDTRQFIEQLARTDAGKRLAKLTDEALAGTLDEIAHEFERLGQASSALFASRARALSLVAAAIIAGAVNVDALRVFGELARDQALAERVVSALDVERNRQARRSTLPPEDTLDERTAEYDEAIAQIRGAATRLTALGLPVGHRYFPYCGEGRPEAATQAATVLVDQRCVAAGESSEFVPYLGWMLSVLLSAGLIGLGAPFWFRIYRSVGSLLPKFQASTNAMGTVTDGARPGDQGDPLPPTSEAVLLARFKAASRSG